MTTSDFCLGSTLLEAIARQYGLKVTCSTRRRKVWRLETDTGPQYLKKTKLPPAKLRFIHAALVYLRQHGFDRAPQFLINRDGEPFIRTTDGFYVLTPWFNGNELDFRLLMDLKQATVFLARFHLQSQGFTPFPTTIRESWPDWPAKLAGRIKQLEDFRQIARAEQELSPFSRLYLRYFEPFYRQAIRSRDRLLTAPYPAVAQASRRRRDFCHHDYSGRNILRAYDNQLLLVDFDYCLQDLRIHDLINLLVRNLKHNGWRIELGRFILTIYHQAARLAPEELQVMQVLLDWPQDFWQVGLQYYYEKLPWPQERFLKKLEHKIRQRFARERFLKEFPEQNGVYRWKV
jgi:CotS family spore coat protein